MTYPTMEEVNNASRMQLARWHRFLPSPGVWAIDKDQDTFHRVLKEETAIMSAIENKFHLMGGFTPEISKAIGWEG